MESKSIQILFPTGEPAGLRVIGEASSLIQATIIPRSRIGEAMARPELRRGGVYFLIGPDETGAKEGLMYVGETGNTLTRLQDHNRHKEFWEEAILCTTKDDSLSATQTEYLEWLCYSETVRAERYGVTNDQPVKRPHATEFEESAIMPRLREISFFLSVLRLPLFVPLQEASKQSTELHCVGPDAAAVGAYVDEGLVVRKGSLARLDLVASSSPRLGQLRQDLVGQGVIERHGDRQLIFLEDHLFDTPSAAANVVLARQANGWKEWKNSDGRELREVVERVG